MTDVPNIDYHSLLYPIAYNMLGDVDDAQDVVQETMLKWLSIETPNVQNVQAYLVKTVVNKCLNFIRDKKRAHKHQLAIAEDETQVSIPSLIEQGPALSLSMLAMLERLSPIERAVFLLKDIFGYSHREIAEILAISEANCRQILRRARRHLGQNKIRFIAEPDRHRRLYETFIDVCEGEDLGQLLEILKEDINLDRSRPAAVIHGPLQVAEYILHWHRQGLQYAYRKIAGGRYALYASQHGIPCYEIELIGDELGISRISIQSIGAKKPLGKREKVSIL